MQHVRVAVYKFKPGTVDEVARRAETGMLPTFRSQPGFVAYGIVKTGADEAVSLSVWETQAQAEKAVQVAATWVKDNIADMTESVQNHVGDLAFFSSRIPVGS
jgi:heme-degrading monooxygenase HmoA